jgi:adenosyl cobinamide kinase/adenosyl cobinamide phosphate guanylyltransferase
VEERLYGRADVLERARLGVDRACSGDGRLILFTGEPGIGKSRLAEQVAAEAAGKGAEVAWGRCWEAGGAPAYWPWIQIFRSLRMNEDPFPRVERDLNVDAAETRFAAFDQAVRSLKARATRRPLALVLDDLHAADAPSLLLLLLLARELPRAPILVIGGYREAELRLTPDRAPVLARIAREAEVIPLARLGPEDVAAWAGDAGIEPSAAGTAELYRITEGHPLFVVEALRLGRGARAEAARSSGLEGVLEEHLARTSPATRRVLEVAAVLGREFSTADLAATASTTADGVHEALREAIGASIVVPAAEFDRFRFSHILLRDRLHADLLPSVRATLHFQAGTAKLARGADAQAVVHHLFEGQSAGRPERIAEVALAAAEASLSRLAFEDAAGLGRRALGLLPSGELPGPLESQLRLVVAESLIRLGQGAEGKALCVQAAELAERAGADELLARAALVHGTELASGTLDQQMIALLRKALARLPDDDSLLRARVMARLAAALTPPASPQHMVEILELMRASTAMARRMGDPYTLLYTLQFAATVANLVTEDERFSTMNETVELATALEQRLVLLQALPAYITTLLARGERARAEATLPGYHQLAAAFAQPIHRIRRALLDSLFCALGGDFDGSDRLSREALALARSSDSGAGSTLCLTHTLSLAQLRGRPELLATDAAAIVAHFERVPSAVSYVAWALAGIGRREEAAARLREVDIAPLGIPSANLMDLMGAAETSVLLADRELGQTLYPRLARAADRMFLNLSPGALLGPTARVLGDLAVLAGRPAEAVRHYDTAIAFCEKLGAPPLVEHCRRLRDLAAAGRRPEARPAPARSSVELRREGEIWTIASPAGPEVRLKHSKGLEWLQYLVAQPGRQVHVLELAGIEHQAGDAGPVLDARAKNEYRARLDDLREELAEAERFGDLGRARRAEHEIEAIAEQLAGAVGRGGRDRRAASDVERTRVNVQRRLKAVIERIAAANPPLGRSLAAAVKTGTYCVYDPL